MFDNFSVRARQVVFAARVSAGQRGGKFIEMGDFLAALITEDRGNIGEKLALSLPEFTGTYVNHSESHVPFFDEGKTFELLARIENTLPKAAPLDLGEEIPLATDLGEVFVAASEIQNRFHKSHVEPLHLWVAIFTFPSCESAGLLQERLPRACDPRMDAPNDNHRTFLRRTFTKGSRLVARSIHRARRRRQDYGLVRLL